jgi:hypothetical protein
LHIHPRVDLPDGSCTHVPERGGEGAVGELQHADVAQDLDQGPEGPKANLASEGKPQSLTLSFKVMQLLRIYVPGVELKP